MRVGLFGALIAIAISAVDNQAPQLSAQPSCQGTSSPTVFAVDPPADRPWSYVTVWGCNLHGRLHSECEVLFGGVRGFPPSGVCSDMMIVAVPIAAQPGSVTVEIQGIATSPFEFNLLPLDVEPDDIFPGIVDAAIIHGADVNTIAAQVGGTANDLGICGSDWCWYQLNVPVGGEVQTSISLYANPDVLLRCSKSSPYTGGWVRIARFIAD